VSNQKSLKNFLQAQGKPFLESGIAAPEDITSTFSTDVDEPTEISKKTFHGTYIGHSNIVGQTNGKIIVRSHDHT